MGAFFLFRTNQLVAQEAVATVFRRKGFNRPRVCSLGLWTLWHYTKQLLGDPNYLERPNGPAVYAVGTPVYRGLAYADTLKQLLADFETGKLDQTRLRGNFALFVWVNGRLSLLTDALDVCHVFVDRERARFSTSLLALLASWPSKQRLNRLAVLEKLATGYVVGPETVVDGIERLTPVTRKQFKAPDLAVIPPPSYRLSLESPGQSFADSVVEHTRQLQQYFTDIAPLGRQLGVDIGLSSGYDSRLLALLARPVFPNLSLHTHWVRGVHDAEKARAEVLARALRLELRVHPEAVFESLREDDMETSLLDGLYYYDARAGDNSGAYSTTYTRRYKMLTLGTQRLRLNGEGGEIYRNYYQTSRARLDFPAWMRNRLYYGVAPLALGGTGMEVQMTGHILRKLSARLGLDVAGTVDLAVTRAYYGEVRLPECEGVLANADMQLAHFLMPFADAELQRTAYALTPHIGVAGRFQAAMIEALDPVIAALPSHYGFPISAETYGHRVKAAIRGFIPDALWLQRKARRFADPKFGRISAEGYRKVFEVSRSVREAEEALRAYVPGFDPQAAMREAPAKATAVFFGAFVREFAGCLRPG